jgi:hypothetical protein
MTGTMNSVHVRPGLHVEHLRHLVRLRQASGWLGILAFTGLLALRGMDRMDPDLVRAAMRDHRISSAHTADPVKATRVVYTAKRTARVS